MYTRKMSIAECKQRIIEAITCYRQRDEDGTLCIPVSSQRPIVVMGPPGIGKTFIMQEIARELGLPLVSYSMTHHTRQSAQGLPSIVSREFHGQSCLVTEYTMSEIIATVCETVEKTGMSEGILFLDEINCISQTLDPIMLQFLQYKTFGQHRLPEGWTVITAGNPPEYNHSARPFDMATEDRLLRMEVDSDYESWRKWAVNEQVHPAVLAYLSIKREQFSIMETTVEQTRFTTPRSWTDLSCKLILCEQLGFPVDEMRVREFIKHPDAAKAFAQYYDLWLKSRKYYDAQKILSGEADIDAIRQRARKARFDERVALLALLIDAQLTNLAPVMRQRAVLENMLAHLRTVRQSCVLKRQHTADAVRTLILEQKVQLEKSNAAGLRTPRTEKLDRSVISFLEECAGIAGKISDSDKAFWSLREHLKEASNTLDADAAAISRQLDRLFSFVEETFHHEPGSKGAEMLLIVTELTNAADAMRFIQLYGCEKYFKHSRSLLFTERQLALNARIDQLGLEDD